MPPYRKPLIASALGMTMLGLLGTSMLFAGSPAHAQMAVFDPRNYAQNIMTAARTLQQVNQQIQQLQNEAQMLTNMGKNLSRIDFPQLDALRRKLTEIDRLMGEARGVDFRVDQLDAQFSRLFPRDFASALTGDARVREARGRLDTSMDALRHTMRVQARVVENVQGDAEVLAEIARKSQDAEGALQASQATNQLLALAAKQQFQLQAMLAAQFRSDALEQARRATQAAEARAATKRFLGSGTAYTPR